MTINIDSLTEAELIDLNNRVVTRLRFLDESRAHCGAFFPWYNTIHRHRGVGLHTAHDVHYGLAAARQAQRATVLATAYAHHPDRFVRQLPLPPALPTAVWINPPKLLDAPTAVEHVAQ